MRVTRLLMMVGVVLVSVALACLVLEVVNQVALSISLANTAQDLLYFGEIDIAVTIGLGLEASTTVLITACLYDHVEQVADRITITYHVTESHGIFLPVILRGLSASARSPLNLSRSHAIRR